MAEIQPERDTIPETVIERAAKAAYGAAVEIAAKQASLEVLPTDKIVTVFKEVKEASDREAAIVIFSLTDDILTDFFRRKLTGKVSSGVDETFLTGNGMLSSAYSKISLLAGLEWIRNITYRNLTLMRKVRNEFAHHVEIRSLKDHPICNYVDSMSITEASIIDEIEKYILDKSERNMRPDALHVRSKYLTRSALTILSFLTDMTLIQASTDHNVDPRSVAEKNPANINNLTKAVVQIVLGLIVDEQPEFRLLRELK